MNTDEGTSSPDDDPSPHDATNLAENSKRALEFVVELLSHQEGVRLNDLQQTVFIKIWQGKAYKEIRQEIRQEGDREYSLEYLSQDVGPSLCKLLSRTLGERVTKKNFRSPILSAQAKARSLRAQLPTTARPLHLDSPATVTSGSGPEQNGFTAALRLANPDPSIERPFHADWMNVPDEPLFVGRSDELDDLSQKILMQNCRMVAIHGLVGIGKTALAVQLVHRVKSDFDVLVWRSLQDSPPTSLDALLTDLWQTLLEFQSLPPEPTVELNCLLRYLSEHRCLILLDGLDIVYRDGVHDGSYRECYKAMGNFLERIGTRPHQSCFVLTSQNNPKEIAMMAAPQVCSHRMKGLRELAGGDMLLARGIIAPPDYDFRSLIQRFAGHPQALRTFAATAKELCQGDLVTFLEQIGEDFPACDYIQHQVHSTFTHLSELERSLLGGLTVINEPATLEQIRHKVVCSSPLNLSTSQVSEVLRSLLRRALVELTNSRYSIPPIVTEYVLAQR